MTKFQQKYRALLKISFLIVLIGSFQRTSGFPPKHQSNRSQHKAFSLSQINEESDNIQSDIITNLEVQRPEALQTLKKESFAKADNKPSGNVTFSTQDNIQFVYENEVSNPQLNQGEPLLGLHIITHPDENQALRSVAKSNNKNQKLDNGIKKNKRKDKGKSKSKGKDKGKSKGKSKPKDKDKGKGKETTTFQRIIRQRNSPQSSVDTQELNELEAITKDLSIDIISDDYIDNYNVKDSNVNINIDTFSRGKGATNGNLQISNSSRKNIENTGDNRAKNQEAEPPTVTKTILITKTVTNCMTETIFVPTTIFRYPPMITRPISNVAVDDIKALWNGVKQTSKENDKKHPLSKKSTTIKNSLQKRSSLTKKNNKKRIKNEEKIILTSPTKNKAKGKKQSKKQKQENKISRRDLLSYIAYLENFNNQKKKSKKEEVTSKEPASSKNQKIKKSKNSSNSKKIEKIKKSKIKNDMSKKTSTLPIQKSSKDIKSNSKKILKTKRKFPIKDKEKT